jgi:hypothetical protein
MVKRALCLLMLVAACYEDRYLCSSSEQCDVGEGGRCEVDGFCSLRELTCPTLREYTNHSGVLSNQCFDDTVAPLNACAGGQPPAKRDGACFTQVCDRLPACCDVAWTDACVQLAQETIDCRLACDTRIAITATRNTTIERWDLRWTGMGWSKPEARNDLEGISWIAPAPATIDPRLAGATDTELIVGDQHITIPADREYMSITSIGFDRDRRDTIATAFVAGGNRVELIKLDTLESKVFIQPASPGFAWGDENRDTYPDAVVRTSNNSYSFLHNKEDPAASFERLFLNQTTVNVNSGNTIGAPPVRSFDFLDFNDDKKLDVAMFGADVRIHMTEAGLAEGARTLDCDPPTTTRPCNSMPVDLNTKMVSFAGAALPTAAGPSIVVATYPHRNVYRVFPNGDVSQLALPSDGCTCTSTCTSCPGADCNCSYSCNTCVPVLAIIVRDVDADHLLDVIAIDAKLQLYIATASSKYVFGAATPVPTAFANTFFSVDVSVSGAPIP